MTDDSAFIEAVGREFTVDLELFFDKVRDRLSSE